MNNFELYKYIEKNSEEILNKEEFQSKLNLKKKLNIKFGIDPTASEIHIGHALILSILNKFQEYGHIINLIIGDFTAKIGDPTGKNILRKPLSIEEISENFKNYLKQISKFLDIKKIKVFYNSNWLKKINLSDFIKIVSNCSVFKILDRDDFKNRYTNKLPIYIHEFLYPILQAYDSVYLKSDIEIGGTDQKFNMLLGRDLLDYYNFEKQVVITVPLLIGLDGVKKMSKSYNNYIGVSESPNQIFGKIMSINDELMFLYIKVLNLYNHSEYLSLQYNIHGVEKFNLKIDLAFRLVTKLYNKTIANEAKEYFVSRFSKKNNNIKFEEINIYIKSNNVSLVKAIVDMKIFRSKSEIYRLIKQNAVSINEKKIFDINYVLEVNKNYVIKIGKLKLFKFIVNKI